MQLALPVSLVPAVCGWFAANGRALPWRETSDPYRIWLSEIMLQQTRIEAVIPYYARFLEAFPELSALVEADDRLLMKLWEGLGYYSRARNLKKAAVIVMREYGGALPPDAALLRKLPGIGDYTAGAVASVAFGLPEPAVDGNVLRVVSRVAAMEDDVLLPAVKKAVTEALREIYPAGRDAALFTEGLMEIGEVVCTPAGEPDCAHCPLHNLCRAASEGTVNRYPVRSGRKERRVEERAVFLVRTADGRILLLRRPDEGLLAGLWEFPNLLKREFEAASETGADGLLSRILPAELLPTEKDPPSAGAPTPLGSAKHLFTHVEWRMEWFGIELPESFPLPPPRSPGEGSRWALAFPEEIRGAFAVPSAFRAWTKKNRNESKGGSL